MAYWIYVLGVPAAVGLAAFHRLTGYEVLGAIVSYITSAEYHFT